MQTIRNIQFTRLLKVDGYLKEFNFRKSNAGAQPKYTVDTIDEKGNRIMIYMEKKDANWKILQTENIPKWILANENSFDEAILETEVM